MTKQIVWYRLYFYSYFALDIFWLWESYIYIYIFTLLESWFFTIYIFSFYKCNVFYELMIIIDVMVYLY